MKISQLVQIFAVLLGLMWPVCLGATLPEDQLVPWVTTPEDEAVTDSYPDNDRPMGPCSKKSCGGRGSENYHVITTYFKDNFHSTCDIFKMNWCLWNPNRCKTKANRQGAYRRLDALCKGEYSSSSFLSSLSSNTEPYAIASSALQDDNDQCCPTRKQYERVWGWKKDVNGKWCYVFGLDTDSDGLPYMYQIAHTGYCGGNKDTAAKGCEGTCRPFTKFVSLVCFPWSGATGKFAMEPRRICDAVPYIENKLKLAISR